MLFFLVTACFEQRIEGTEVGDCSDGADNDDDGSGQGAFEECNEENNSQVIEGLCQD